MHRFFLVKKKLFQKLQWLSLLHNNLFSTGHLIVPCAMIIKASNFGESVSVSRAGRFSTRKSGVQRPTPAATCRCYWLTGEVTWVCMWLSDWENEVLSEPYRAKLRYGWVLVLLKANWTTCLYDIKNKNTKSLSWCERCVHSSADLFQHEFVRFAGKWVSCCVSGCT